MTKRETDARQNQKELTEEQVQALADEAEQGYDPARIIPKDRPTPERTNPVDPVIQMAQALEDADFDLGSVGWEDPDEAWRTLARAAIAVLPQLSQPRTTMRVKCKICGENIELLNNGTDRWWVHDAHPADGHDAEPGGTR